MVNPIELYINSSMVQSKERFEKEVIFENQIEDNIAKFFVYVLFPLCHVVIKLYVYRDRHQFFTGTFQAEKEETVVYGLVHPLSSWDPIYTQVSRHQRSISFGSQFYDICFDTLFLIRTIL